MSEPGVTGGASETEPEELSDDGVKIGLGEQNSFEPEEDPEASPEGDNDET